MQQKILNNLPHHVKIKKFYLVKLFLSGVFPCTVVNRVAPSLALVFVKLICSYPSLLLFPLLPLPLGIGGCLSQQSQIQRPTKLELSINDQLPRSLKRLLQLYVGSEHVACLL